MSDSGKGYEVQGKKYIGMEYSGHRRPLWKKGHLTKILHEERLQTMCISGEEH